MPRHRRTTNYRRPLDPIRGKTVEDRLEILSRARALVAIDVLAVGAVVVGIWSAIVMDSTRDRVLSALAALVGAIVLAFVIRYYRKPVDPARVRDVETLWDRIRRLGERT